MHNYILVFAILILQSSICFAKDSINLTFVPDPITNCHQFGIDFVVTRNSTLGLLSAVGCQNRPTFGKINEQVTNTFNRVLVPWRYSPQGAFNTGYFFDTMIGFERSEFKTAAGSSANVVFIDTAIHLGYQWFWRNRANLSAFFGVAHLIRNGLEQNISQAENSMVSSYLGDQTSSNTHFGVGLQFGWTF